MAQEQRDDLIRRRNILCETAVRNQNKIDSALEKVGTLVDEMYTYPEVTPAVRKSRYSRAFDAINEVKELSVQQKRYVERTIEIDLALDRLWSKTA